MNDTRARILIIDDDEHVLMALERVLESEGYCTATAWSGQEALEILRKSDFDLLLVDEHLPDLNVVSLIKDLQRTRHRAYRVLMCPLPDQRDGAERLAPPGIHGSVCKWEHGAITAKIRSYLPFGRTFV